MDLVHKPQAVRGHPDSPFQLSPVPSHLVRIVAHMQCEVSGACISEGD
jgi:hypothetical protein